MSSENNPSGAPIGTTYTVMCGDIKRNDLPECLSTFKTLGWGDILGTRTVFSHTCENRYNVFIHFGKINPNMSAVFQHLEYGGDIKINLDDGFWRAQLIIWVSPPKNIPEIEANPMFSLMPLSLRAPRWVRSSARAACGVYKN